MSAQAGFFQEPKIPAPVRGWNTVDSLGKIPPDMAYILDNLIPGTSSVAIRKGKSSFATGVGSGNVDSLFQLKTLAVSKMIAAASGNFYDVSSSGVASVISTGFTNNIWNSTVFNNQLGLVNGSDLPQVYDGTTMSNMTVSGPSSISALLVVESFKNRTIFAEANSGDFWYSALNALGGVLTKFPLSRVGSFGGNLIAIRTLTRDGGAGQQNNICFFMSSGEVIEYSGSDPGSDFSLIGIYKTGRPITQRAIIGAGPDITFVNSQGYQAISTLLPLSYGKDDNGVNHYIKGAASAAIDSYFAFDGWQAIISYANNFMLINVPQSNNTFVQHVLNLNTNAWCRFTNFNARCWCEFGNTLYYGGTNGTIYRYGPNYTDEGTSINAIYQSGYISLGGGPVQTTAFRPRTRFDGSLNLTIKKSFDFKEYSPPYTINYSTTGASWGDPWGTMWATSGYVNGFINFNGIGFNASIYLGFQTSAPLDFFEIDFLLKRGSRI